MALFDQAFDLVVREATLAQTPARDLGGSVMITLGNDLLVQLSVMALVPLAIEHLPRFRSRWAWGLRHAA